MVFSSFSFLLVFFPAVCLCYFAVPQRFRRARNLILLAFSLLFYFWGEARGVLLMLAVILVSYCSALLIGRTRSQALRRLGLWLELAVCLGVLFYFKYADWLIGSANSLLGTAVPLPEVIMPIGISFFTFQSMSYVFDVYRGKVPAQRNLLCVALYVSLFPQLVAGPIVRYETVAEEIVSRRENLEDVYAGLQRFIMGLGKKLLLADVFGREAEAVFAMNSALRGTPTAWLGALCFSLQIYFDFSGYSDMAIGMGRMFGFHFLENFNYPYISRSVTEFWRRWHISLSTWFRDYVYIPLGGNRRGLPRQLLNLLAVWALTGLWHGASWNFVLWGLYYFLLLVLEKLLLGRLLKRLPAFLGSVYTLLAVVLGWVLFNCTEPGQLSAYLGDLFAFRGGFDHVLLTLRQNIPEFLFGLALCAPLPMKLFRLGAEKPWAELLRCLWLLVILVLSVLTLTGSSFNAFIYFRF